MANKRIDQLPTSDNQIQGTDKIPVFSDGRTERITVDELGTYIGSNVDTYVTGATYSNGTLTLGRNDGVDLTVNGLYTGGTVPSANTQNHGILIFKDFGSDVSLADIGGRKVSTTFARQVSPTPPPGYGQTYFTSYIIFEIEQDALPLIEDINTSTLRVEKIADNSTDDGSTLINPSIPVFKIIDPDDAWGSLLGYENFRGGMKVTIEDYGVFTLDDVWTYNNASYFTLASYQSPEALPNFSNKKIGLHTVRITNYVNTIFVENPILAHSLGSTTNYQGDGDYITLETAYPINKMDYSNLNGYITEHRFNMQETQFGFIIYNGIIPPLKGWSDVNIYPTSVSGDFEVFWINWATPYVVRRGKV